MKVETPRQQLEKALIRIYVEVCENDKEKTRFLVNYLIDGLD